MSDSLGMIVYVVVMLVLAALISMIIRNSKSKDKNQLKDKNQSKHH